MLLAEIPRRIDLATDNIVQDIHIFETRLGPEGMALAVIETLPAMQNAFQGCKL